MTRALRDEHGIAGVAGTSSLRPLKIYPEQLPRPEGNSKPRRPDHGRLGPACTSGGPRSAWSRTQTKSQRRKKHTIIHHPAWTHASVESSAADLVTLRLAREEGGRLAASHLNGSLRIAWRNMKHGHCRVQPPEGLPFSVVHSVRIATSPSLPRYRANARTAASGSPDLGSNVRFHPKSASRHRTGTPPALDSPAPLHLHADLELAPAHSGRGGSAPLGSIAASCTAASSEPFEFLDKIACAAVISRSARPGPVYLRGHTTHGAAYGSTSTDAEAEHAEGGRAGNGCVIGVAASSPSLCIHTSQR
ncbi:hypothetical protein DAEQUDRAFT_737757 [Daedalea quercina L-15889]|uniref:Uncharacterized protein n=1 Tax=Daedalea quercina L-15889 TaxID=1314783 RepID=A0A165QWZ6_9APHY|nr:hypothetical protein DAEQUDRAFT_737757 [Daedalea quercina L-15889]